MAEIIKHINDTNASYRSLTAGDAKNTDLFFDQGHYSFFGGVNRTIKVRLHKTNLSQSILFIASILPRKYDLGAKHYIVEYSSKFVEENLAILDSFFMVDGVRTENRIVEWNVRKDIMQKNGKIDDRLYLNGLQFDLPYESDGNQLSTKFSIRNYLAGGYSNLRMISNEDDIYDLYISNVTEAYFEDDGIVEEIEEQNICLNNALQQIYYGAPGTGKSHIINEQVCNESVIRTTFHPDSDYSTFVGCYKPTTKTVKMRDLSGHVIKENGVELTEDRIVYEFVEQAFLQAYIQAWKFYGNTNEEVKKQFLVIEEINRGNCAQIFGDLFQLLDRNMWGFSDYPIKADNDMHKQLAKAFNGLEISQENKDRINACYKGGKDIVQQVMSGEILLLPDNFYIWATMNTSDQSLFPIDSAFKRRWDWQYMPIAKGRENGKDMNWRIVANENEYDWWSFLTKINEQIGSTTNSEDKKLGFFFCKAVNGKISAETFVGKVIFYLWNDVFKDFGFDNAIFNDEDGSTLSFNKFYATENGKVIVRKDKVELFLKNLGVEIFEEIDYEPEESLELVEPEEQNEVAELSGDTEHSELERTRYRYWGDFLKYINKTVYKDIFNTEKRNPVYKKFYDFGIGSSETNLYIGYDEDVTVVGYWVKSKSLYDKFVSYKSVIEQSCGELKWIEINKACKIIKEFSFRGKSQEEQFKLMLDEIVRMRELFIKYVK